MSKLIDLTGKVYGRLTVLSFSHSKKWSRYWKCQCSCGQIHITKTKYLENGDTTSCGCIRGWSRTSTLEYRGTKEYSTWKGIKKRCYNPNDQSYKHYGAIGISVCKEWRESFHVFLRDMGLAPSRYHSIDRKDVRMGYSPDNCRWATMHEQALNKSNTLSATIGGVTKPIKIWAAEYNIDYEVVRHRITSYKWDALRALTQPIAHLPKRKKVTCL